jgi:hypothetical protein
MGPISSDAGGPPPGGWLHPRFPAILSRLCPVQDLGRPWDAGVRAGVRHSVHSGSERLAGALPIRVGGIIE